MQESLNPIDIIRSVNRNELKDLRNKQKENLLCTKRLSLHEVSAYVHDVTLAEFKELLLKLRHKRVPLELLRKIKSSCISDEYIEAFFRNDGAFNSLIRILIGNNAQKQLEAAACLTNLACGSHKCSYKVAKASGAYLVSFINGSSNFLQDQSAWAVANIANDCSECFNIIKAQGVLPALFKTLESPLSSVVQSVVFALNACTKYDDPKINSLIQSGLSKRLICCLEQNNSNRSTFLDAAFTLSTCCYLSLKYSLDVFNADAVKRILNILLQITQNQGVDILVAIPLIRCLGFLSYSDEICKLISVSTEFHKSIQVIMAAEECLPLKKEVIWILCNITASRTVSSCSIFLLPVIASMREIIKVDDLCILQVLYFLLCVASKDESVIPLLKQHEIYAQIKCLSERGQSEISEATKLFLEIVQ